MSSSGSGMSDTPDTASISMPRARCNYPKSILKLTLMGSYTLWCYWVFVFLRAVAPSGEAKTEVAMERAHRWFKGCVRLAGFNVECHGVVPDGAYLIAPNHLGYADIVALGSIFKCFFVAKADVESWPIIGFLFKQSEQIGVPRDSRRGVLSANEHVRDRLSKGRPVCVFLEGTSSGGGDVLPFHASLLQPALDAHVPVVPVAIRWTCDQAGTDVAEDIAYWKDHVLVPHLIRLMGLRGCHVKITIGEPISSNNRERKEWAIELQEKVGTMLEEKP